MKLFLLNVCLLAAAYGAQAAYAAVRHPASEREEADDDLYTLPDGLLVGAGLSAVQAEGAWNYSDKAESLLDHMTHIKDNKMFTDTTDVAADHFTRWKEDLGLAKQLEFTSHRFSISWSRVLPTGDPKHPSKEGVDFYNKYIDELIRLKLEPMVTMLHFDQPYSLEIQTKGWHHREIVDKYVEYADFLFKTFGDRVKYWTTINEPNMYCNYFPTLMESMGIPQEKGFNIYQCMHNMILAHTKAYRLYEKTYKKEQKGFVGGSALLWPGLPATTSVDDVIAAEQFNQLLSGTFLHPLVYGDYSPTSKYLVDARTAELGLNKSRLPEFTAEEKKDLEGGVTDFISINVYSKFEVSASISGASSKPALLGPIVDDLPPNISLKGNLYDGSDESLMHATLLWTWSTYHKPIVIGENGYGDQNGAGIRDTVRAAYHSANMRSLVRTIKQNKIKVIGYYMWALLDLFEFTAGYLKRPFGVIHVDYQTGSLNRTLKDSSSFFIELGKTKKVPLVPMPTSKAWALSPAVFLTALAWFCTQIASI